MFLWSIWVLSDSWGYVPKIVGSSIKEYTIKALNPPEAQTLYLLHENNSIQVLRKIKQQVNEKSGIQSQFDGLSRLPPHHLAYSHSYAADTEN